VPRRAAGRLLVVVVAITWRGQGQGREGRQRASGQGQRPGPRTRLGQALRTASVGQRARSGDWRAHL